MCLFLVGLEVGGIQLIKLLPFLFFEPRVFLSYYRSCLRRLFQQRKVTIHAIME